MIKEEYIFYSVFKGSGDRILITKEYNDIFSAKLYNFINKELSVLWKCQDKFIIKLKEYYYSKDKTIFAFDYFEILLKNFKKNVLWKK